MLTPKHTSWYFLVRLNRSVCFVSIRCSSGHTVLIRRNSSNFHLYVIKKSDELQERHWEHMLSVSAARTGLFFFFWPVSSCPRCRSSPLPLRCRADRVAARKWLIPARLWERQLPPYFSKIQKLFWTHAPTEGLDTQEWKRLVFSLLPTSVKLLGTVAKRNFCSADSPPHPLPLTSRPPPRVDRWIWIYLSW